MVHCSNYVEYSGNKTNTSIMTTHKDAIGRFRLESSVKINILDFLSSFIQFKVKFS